MKILYILTLLVGAGVAGMAFAAGHLAEMDANGDGMLSYDELVAVFPDLSEEAFGVADGNSDGGIDMDELLSAEDGGLIPMVEG